MNLFLKEFLTNVLKLYYYFPIIYAFEKKKLLNYVVNVSTKSMKESVKNNETK